MAKLPIDGWTAVRMDGGWTDGLVDGRKERRLDGWNDGGTDGRMDGGWTGGMVHAWCSLCSLRTDGRTDDRIWTEDGRTAGRFEYLLFDKITY